MIRTEIVKKIGTWNHLCGLYLFLYHRHFSPIFFFGTVLLTKVEKLKLFLRFPYGDVEIWKMFSFADDRLSESLLVVGW